MKTQLAIIKELLETQGYVTRNQLLSRFISRGAARINDLEHEGYEFETRQEDSDYIYKLVRKPPPKQLSL